MIESKLTNEELLRNAERDFERLLDRRVALREQLDNLEYELLTLDNELASRRLQLDFFSDQVQREHEARCHRGLDEILNTGLPEDTFK